MDPYSAQMLSTLTLPRYNVEFYFGLFAFLFSILVGAYYIIDWEHYHAGRRLHATLFWGLGSILSFWFQIPFLIANAGLQVVVTEYHPLFSTMIPLAFLGVLLIYRGVRELSNPGDVRLDKGLGIWFIVCAGFYGFFFYYPSLVSSYAVILFGGMLFFVPIFSALLIEIVGWYKKIDLHVSPYTAIGLVLFCGAILLQLATCVAAFFSITRLPPQLWFVALMSSATPFVLQSVSVIMLTCGQYYLHKEQAPHADAKLLS